MKQLVLFAAILMGTTLTSCGNKGTQESEAPVVETAVEEVIVTDSVAQDSVLADTIVEVAVAADSIAAK